MRNIVDPLLNYTTVNIKDFEESVECFTDGDFPTLKSYWQYIGQQVDFDAIMNPIAVMRVTRRQFLAAQLRNS